MADAGPGSSSPPTWEVRVKHSQARYGDVSVLGEHRYEDLSIFDQPAEIVVGDTVKRIERVDDRARRNEVPGEAYLVLRGVSVEDVPIGALIRGPAR